MKKVMFAAAVAAGLVAFGEGLESNNTVGYNTADIQQIGISDGGAGTIGWGTENFSVWEGIPTVADGSEFVYWDASMDPAGEATGCYWGDDTCAKVTYDLPAGQGVVINCAAGLTISIDPPAAN